MCEIEVLVRHPVMKAAFPGMVRACIERILLLQQQHCGLKIVIKAGLHQKFVNVI
jgi:hypothetical protein